MQQQQGGTSDARPKGPQRPRQRKPKPKPEGGNAQSPAAPAAPVKRTPTDSDLNDTKKKPKRGGRRNKPAGANSAAAATRPAAALDEIVDEDDDVDVDASVATTPTTMDHLSDVLFSSLEISEKTKRAIVQDLKYERLTIVQKETFPHILAGKDVLAKAKTGNGKTIAFLLPVIENFVRAGRSSRAIPVLVISPTRELALQIATEARRLTKFHALAISCFVGGSSINKDVRSLTSETPLDILIATPGRLLDHIGQDTGSIRAKLGKTSVLILDEADRLLDMGFRPEILKIVAVLPKERQTLLFSATLPASTEELKRVALRADYAFVDTIDEDDHQTNVQTVQECVVCPFDDVYAVTEHVLAEHMTRPQYKVMVFLPTARSAQFAAQLFIAAGFPNVLEIHSRKSQSARTKAADAFRTGKKVIMFSSDVSARGVDYPDVSLVLQVGLTDRDQYVHRLGRTARAGMEGRGILVLADFERPFLRDLKDLPLVEKEVALTPHAGFRTTAALAKLKPGSELEKSAVQSYQAWLGFYNSNQKKLNLNKEKLVELAEVYSHVIGLEETPRIELQILRKMGLFGVKGLEPATQADRLKFKPKSSSSSAGGSRGGRGREGRASPSRERAGERLDRRPMSPTRREPRNFGESPSTPEAERFIMKDSLPSDRVGRERRDGASPYARSRSDDERPSRRFSERGDRDSRERFDESPTREESRGRRTDRFEHRVERPSSDRQPRGGDEDASPTRERFNRSRDERGGRGRDSDDRPDRRASSAPRDGASFRRGSGGSGSGHRSRSEPRTTSHRRDRGEQRRRERGDRQGKRF